MTAACRKSRNTATPPRRARILIWRRGHTCSAACRGVTADGFGRRENRISEVVLANVGGPIDDEPKGSRTVDDETSTHGIQFLIQEGTADLRRAGSGMFHLALLLWFYLHWSVHSGFGSAVLLDPASATRPRT